MKNIHGMLVIEGGTVKSEGEDGVVTGAGIVFGSPEEPDRSSQRDFFTDKSFINKKNKITVPLFYDHGVGAIDEQIGEATLVKQADGWKATAQIDLSTDAGQQVYESVKTEPHGFSTGAMVHLITRVPQENGTNWLKKWVVGELSLTKRPAERKALVYAVKSLDGTTVPLDDITMELIISNKDGEVVWTSENDSYKSLADLTDAATLEVKYVNGSVTYNISHYDEEAEKYTEVSVYEWGGVRDLAAHLRLVSEKVDAALAAADTQETEDMMKSEGFEARVQEVVKKLLAQHPDSDVNSQISTLEEANLKMEQELAELKQTVADREGQLTIANEKIAQLEILAGAKQQLEKLKGN